MCKCGNTSDSYKYIRSINVIEPGAPFATPFIFALCEICESEKIAAVKADPAFKQPNQFPSSSWAIPFNYPTREYVASVLA